MFPERGEKISIGPGEGRMLPRLVWARVKCSGEEYYARAGTEIEGAHKVKELRTIVRTLLKLLDKYGDCSNYEIAPSVTPSAESS